MMNRWIYHCHNDFHASSGMAGVIVVDAATIDWNQEAIGEAVFAQCGFTTQDGKGFANWVRPCCTSPGVCPAGPPLMRGSTTVN
jgi:hypothetical protein